MINAGGAHAGFYINDQDLFHWAYPRGFNGWMGEYIKIKLFTHLEKRELFANLLSSVMFSLPMVP